MATRVFLHDDHELVRRRVRDLVSAEDDIIVEREASTGEGRRRGRRQAAAVRREAVSNVVRHSSASQMAVSVGVTAKDLVVAAIDDGVGAGDGQRPGGNGLANLRHRAEALGGALDLQAGSEAMATALRWQVPLSGDGH